MCKEEREMDRKKDRKKVHGDTGRVEIINHVTVAWQTFAER